MREGVVDIGRVGGIRSNILRVRGRTTLGAEVGSNGWVFWLTGVGGWRL